MKYIGWILALGLSFLSSELSAQTEAPWIEFSSKSADQNWYHKTLFKALKRVIGEHEEILELATNLKRGASGAVKRDQILITNHVRTFEDFIHRIALQVDPELKAWLALEEKKKAGQATARDVAIQRGYYLKAKISPEELVVVYDFYRSIRTPDSKRAPESFFLQSRPLHRSDIPLAREVKSYTNWPITPRRTHGKNLPKVALDVPAWSGTFALFARMKMESLFDEIWSQWVNLEAGNATTRHIVSFEDFFIYRCKELSATQPYRAFGLLQAYLINRVSSESIIAEKTSVRSKGLTALLIYMHDIRNANQARLFFEGKWPEALLNENTDEPEGWAKIPARIHDVLQNGPKNDLYYKLPGCAGNLATSSEALKK